MSRELPVSLWQRAQIVLAVTVVGSVAVFCLSAGRPVLIPVAVAVLLTFLLNPLVRNLEHRGLGRVTAVMAVVSIAAILLTGSVWSITGQVGGMLAELPQKTAHIKAKINSLKQLTSGRLSSQFQKMFEEILEELPSPPGELTTESSARRTGESSSPKSSETIVVTTQSFPWLTFTGYLSSLLEVLATLAFTLVLLVAFLLERDNLRDRIVLLAGKARLALTSKALEDITDRISRYMLMVAMINGSYGLILTIGLMLCGVPYAVLWGLLAAVMRFIPYIGPWVGALFPLIMSFATSSGWGQPLAVFGYIVVLELISNNIIEPLVFGRSTGVSPTALLISAAFWLFLWGPIGLVLSTPFAVCLVVLGRNIPQLAFLNLLLGDEPAVRENVGIYLRLMQGDHHEAVKLVMQRLNDAEPDATFDEMLVPALNFTKRDLARDFLTEADRSTILGGVRESLRQCEAFLTTSRQQQAESSTGTRPRAAETRPVRILGCPAVDELDIAALEMLDQLLDPNQWELEVTALDTLTSELVARIAAEPPAAICIASVPPGGISHARYLCKRLRAAAPDLLIIAGRWGRHRNARIDRERLEQSGASFVTATLVETRRLLQSRLPLLSRPRSSAVPDADSESAADSAADVELSAVFPHTRESRPFSVVSEFPSARE